MLKVPYLRKCSRKAVSGIVLIVVSNLPRRTMCMSILKPNISFMEVTIVPIVKQF